MSKIITERSEIVFSLSDDIYFNPEIYFSKMFLESITPYKIFTGVGLAVTMENDRFEHETLYLKSEKSLKRIKHAKSKKEVIQVQDCFFAYVVHQSSCNDFFSGSH